MPTVVVTARAVADLNDIGEYLLAFNPDAALRTVRQLRLRCENLAEAPLSGHRLAWRKDIRRLVCGAYVIFYRAQEDRIEVIRILHGSRDLRPLLGEE